MASVYAGLTDKEVIEWLRKAEDVLIALADDGNERAQEYWLEYTPASRDR